MNLKNLIFSALRANFAKHVPNVEEITMNYNIENDQIIITASTRDVDRVIPLEESDKSKLKSLLIFKIMKFIEYTLDDVSYKEIVMEIDIINEDLFLFVINTDGELVNIKL